MNAPARSRQQILDRIRTATQSAAKGPEELAGAYAALPRPYARAGKLDAEACIALMMERLREYGAEVVETTPDELPAAITAQIAASGRRIFVAPPGTPSAWYVEPAWKIEGFECTFDHGLTTREIEQAEGVMTAAFCGIADSGTIVLHHSATEGRRVLTLRPDWHLCILKASQVVETLPEYFDRCAPPPALHPSDQDPSLRPSDQDPSLGTPVLGTPALHPSGQDASPALATYISGPSATADIEMTRIKGVHGPRYLQVILVRDTN